MYNLILIRGVSGSGKSTVANIMTGLSPDTTLHLSTDFYFYPNYERTGKCDGGYNFNPSLLKMNHTKCINAASEAMSKTWGQQKIFDEKAKIGSVNDLDVPKIKTIIVANTFTQEWEMKPYMNSAAWYDFDVHTIIVEKRHGHQNTHGVDADAIKSQIDRFDVKLHSEEEHKIGQAPSYKEGKI